MTGGTLRARRPARARRTAVTTSGPAGVRVTSPAPRDVWAELLVSDPDAFVTQTPQWLDCLCARRGERDASRLYELPHGRRLLLPLAARHLAGIQVTEQSLPYAWGYGGLLAEGGRLTEDDCRLVLADLAARRVVRASVVPMPLRGATWSAAAPGGAVALGYTSQVIDLDGGFDAVWSGRFRKQVRTRVRKAQRMELDIRREAGVDAAPERGGRGLAMFAELYRGAVDKWAAQAGQPLWLARRLAVRRDRPGQVAAVAAALGACCETWSATYQGRPVAVDVVLRHGRHSLGWLSAMDPALARETPATYRLLAEEVEDACRAGVRWFHLGESEAGSGVEQFKANFGAESVSYQALGFERLPLTAGEQRLRAALAFVSGLRTRGRGDG